MLSNGEIDLYSFYDLYCIFYSLMINFPHLKI